MPNTQTLQLYFVPTTSTTQDGLFADNNGNPSKVWKDQSGNYSGDHSITVRLVDAVALGANVTIGLPQNWIYSEISTGQCLRVTAVFGRNKKTTSSAIYGSPFTIGNLPTNYVQTVFDQWYPATTVTGSGGSITLPFGTARLGSGSGNTDKYAFIVAMTVYCTDNSNPNNPIPYGYTAGHDPEMDVSC
jgi:hypothetical protein